MDKCNDTSSTLISIDSGLDCALAYALACLMTQDVQ